MDLESLVSASQNGPSGNFGQVLLQLQSAGLNLLRTLLLVRLTGHTCLQELLFLMHLASLLGQEAPRAWAGSQEAEPVLVAVTWHRFVPFLRSLQLTAFPCWFCLSS